MRHFELSASLFHRIQTYGFVGLLTVVGVLFTLTPKDTVSLAEKRNLAQFPEFTTMSLADGSYMRSIDDYVADNFLLREPLTMMAGQFKEWRGMTTDDIQLVMGSHSKSVGHSDGAKSEADETATAGKGVATSDKHSKQGVHATDDGKSPAQSASSAKGTSTAEETPYQNIESIIIFNGKAVQMYGASPATTAPFVRTVNQYLKELPNVTVYVMGIPIGADFYLPEKVNKGAMREKVTLNHLKEVLPPSVRFVNAYDKIGQHKSEYAYFNTDHHWTGLGAYYAYTAFAETAGFSALPLDAFTKKEIPNFLGTLYYRTLSPVLKKNIDTVEYFKVPVQTKVSYFSNNSTQGKSTQLYAEYAKDGNAYGVFLGGDYPLLRIHSDAGTGRKIMVIKDSYGNAFVPYLASHYDDVFVVDYRYFNGSLKNWIEKEGIRELLFAHNTYVLSSPYTANRASAFLHGVSAKPAEPKPVESKPAEPKAAATESSP